MYTWFRHAHTHAIPGLNYSHTVVESSLVCVHADSRGAAEGMRLAPWDKTRVAVGTALRAGRSPKGRDDSGERRAVVVVARLAWEEQLSSLVRWQ